MKNGFIRKNNLCLDAFVVGIKLEERVAHPEV